MVNVPLTFLGGLESEGAEMTLEGGAGVSRRGVFAGIASVFAPVVGAPLQVECDICAATDALRRALERRYGGEWRTYVDPRTKVVSLIMAD